MLYLSTNALYISLQISLGVVYRFQTLVIFENDNHILSVESPFGPLAQILGRRLAELTADVIVIADS